jgi:hypothetical protein
LNWDYMCVLQNLALKLHFEGVHSRAGGLMGRTVPAQGAQSWDRRERSSVQKKATTIGEVGTTLGRMKGFYQENWGNWDR